MKQNISVIGGAIQDITFYSDDGQILDNPKNDPTCLKLLGFEYGAKVKIDKANFSFGGGAQNAAVCFSRLGFNVVPILSVGQDDTGKGIIKNLKGNKVNTRFIQIQKNVNTGFSFILTDKKTSEHVVFSYRGASSELSVGSQILKKINPKWVYMTSLSGKWEKDVLVPLFKYKEKNKIFLAWNPGKLQLRAGYKKLKKYLKNTQVLSLNKDEATELCISAGGKCEEGTKGLIEELYGIIFKKIPLTSFVKGGKFRIILITDGKRGAYAYDGKKVYFSPIINVKRVDTTGVGDAFGSSFIAGLNLYKGDIKKALDLGNLNTSSVIGKIGAENGLLYKKDI